MNNFSKRGNDIGPVEKNTYKRNNITPNKESNKNSNIEKNNFLKREIDDVYEEKNDLNTYKGNKITNKGKNFSANKKIKF